jgi:hypothetical protein
MVAPREVPELKIRERPPSTLRNIDVGPPGGAGAGDPGAPTINAKKHRRRAPREVPELKIQKRPPSTLRNIDGAPPREVPEMEIRERPPSTLRNVDGRPPGGVRAKDPGASTINTKKHRRRALGRRSPSGIQEVCCKPAYA